MRLLPVLPALAALAALGLPATAQADVTTAVNGHTLTVTGSAGTDTITLRAAGGVITVNDVPTTLPANRGAIIVVNAGDGNDSIDAQTDDRIAARDGAADRVQGGAGTDSARTDALTLDVVDGVENVDAPPLPSPPAPAPAPVQTPAPSTGSGTTAIPVPKVAGDTSALLPTVGRARVLRRHGRLVVALPVTCPAAETGGCRSMLTLRAGHTAVGHRTVRLDGGAHATVTIRLARAATRLVRHRLRLRIATADAAGNTAAGTVAVALRLPRR